MSSEVLVGFLGVIIGWLIAECYLKDFKEKLLKLMQKGKKEGR